MTGSDWGGRRSPWRFTFLGGLLIFCNQIKSNTPNVSADDGTRLGGYATPQTPPSGPAGKGRVVVITREGIVDPFLKRENIFLKGFDHFVPNAYVFMGKMVKPPGIPNGQRCLRWYWPRQGRR